jgi:hypothetical protein
MYKGHQDNFVIVNKKLLIDWKPHHVTIGLFKASDITKQGLIKQLKALLEKFGFISKVLSYVKDEGINLAIMTTFLKFVTSCDALSLPIHLDYACFGHVMSQIAKYATNGDKISKELTLINLKFAQTSFQSHITWPTNRYVDKLNFLVQVFVGSKMYNKIDIFLSLCTIRKGGKDGGKHA